MKVYVAGKYSDKEYINSRIQELKKMGCVITHNWTKVESDSPKTTTNELAECAHSDVDAVKNADVVVAIMDDPKYAYRGTFTEIGVALGTNKNIIVLCPEKNSYCCSNIFFHHKTLEKVICWDDVLKKLNDFYESMW